MDVDGSPVILPGTTIPAHHVNLKLGPGLLHSSDFGEAGLNVITTKAGTVISSNKGSRWWIETNSRRYVPAPQESVIGVIVQKVGEGYRVDIGSAHYASLDGLAFEGATKRNKPNLKIGCLVYARVSLAHKDMEPELECFDAKTRKSNGFGEVKGGFLVKCSLGMCRNVLDPKHFLLPLLGGKFPLEVAVGMNGRIWVNAKESKQIITVSRCIEAVDPDGGGTNETGVRTLLGTLDI